MPKTTNYNLEKPNDNNTADIAVINNNMDIVDTELFNKVDKVAGKGLSSNDFTDVEKQKLGELSNFDSSGVDEHMANTVKHITTAERTNWNAKVSESSSHINNVSNPHGVTAEQIGAATKADIEVFRMQNQHEGVRVEYTWVDGTIIQQRHYDASDNLIKKIDYTWVGSKIQSEVYQFNSYDGLNILFKTVTVTITYTWVNNLVTSMEVITS